MEFVFSDPVNWEGDWVIRKLNPTGRWKVEYDPYNQVTLFIEHRGWIFRYWIPEDWIDIQKPPIINDCNQKNI